MEDSEIQAINGDPDTPRGSIAGSVVSSEDVQASPRASEEPEAVDTDVKPPEVVAFITKSPKTSKYDTLSKKNRFQIGCSLIDPNFEADRISSKSSDSERLNSRSESVTSTADSFQTADADEIEDFDENLFSGSKKVRKPRGSVHNQLFGIHSIDKDLNLKKNTSTHSLHSVNSLPGFLNGNLRKWSNTEELDDISSGGVNDKWVIGDTSDSGMFSLLFYLLVSFISNSSS